MNKVILGIFFLVSSVSLISAEELNGEELLFGKLDQILNEIKIVKSEMTELKAKLKEIEKGAANNKVTGNNKNPSQISSVKLDDDPFLGNEGAEIAIVEFSDFECPFCRRHYQKTLPMLKANYINTDKIKYVFKDFPLGFHKKAIEAAIAANCAGEQNAYWEMHGGLFQFQKEIGSGLYEKLVSEYKLDFDDFKNCMNEQDASAEIDNDLAYGQELGVRGTPHFFVGRIVDGKLMDVRSISGAQPYSVFKNTIDKIIEESSKSADVALKL